MGKGDDKKIYKQLLIDYINMIPGDLKRLPDESFIINSGVFHGKHTGFC